MPPARLLLFTCIGGVGCGRALPQPPRKLHAHQINVVPAGRAPLLSAPSPTPQCDAFTRHVRQMSGHDVSVAAEKRARWKSAFMAAPTKRCSPPRPAWRASVGRAAPHSSHPCHALNLPYGSYGAMEQFIQSPPSSGTLVHLCRSGRLLVLWSTTGNLQGQSPTQRSTQTTPSMELWSCLFNHHLHRGH